MACGLLERIAFWLMEPGFFPFIQVPYAPPREQEVNPDAIIRRLR